MEGEKMEKILGAKPDLTEINIVETTGFLEYLRKKIKFTEECFSTAQNPEAKAYYLNQKRALEDLMKQVIKYLSRQEECSKFSFEEKLKSKLKPLEEILANEELDDEEKQIAIHERTKLENYRRELSDFKNKRLNFS